MKNKDEEPKEYFERNSALVIIMTVAALTIDWFSIKMLLDVNPWGTATAIPGLILTLQALWFIVNPYAVVYENRFEIKQSLLYNKEFYYLDAKSIAQKTSNSVQLIYNDDDIEQLPLIGMRDSHKQKFREALNDKIVESLKNRNF
ncbi:MAG: hypothetical protein K0S53_2439 [Bacteroidetes bacterium]|nr:hypothetical protein [Bacteroidota bacterium]MDF2453196.1 hypothetical protein [Bacteroidota bacterium]